MMERKHEIYTWLCNYFKPEGISSLSYIAGDASQRRYLRFNTASDSFIVMDSPKDPSMAKFIKIAGLLTKYDIKVPQILHYDMSRGLILMSDLGSNLYLDLLKNAAPVQINTLYVAAITSLVKIQTIPTDYNQSGYVLENMDHNYIDHCLEIFKVWYINTHKQDKQLGYSEDLLIKLRKLFNQAFTMLPCSFVHLDYHSRNLLLTNDSSLGVIDFQDAMQGPLAYDLVSLLQDAYISWPRTQVEKWVQVYKEFASDAGLLPNMSTDELLYSFDLIGLQRHIKNLGVFARLHHRDKKSNYLNDIPMLLKYILDATNRHQELSWLKQFIMEEVQA